MAWNQPGNNQGAKPRRPVGGLDAPAILVLLVETRRLLRARAAHIHQTDACVCGGVGEWLKAVHAAGFAYIDDRNFFCIQNNCPLIVKNMLTHRDQGHVTNTFATWLSPMFAPIFKDGS